MNSLIRWATFRNLIDQHNLKNEILLLKGSRYFFRNRLTKIPIMRRIGSLFMEPLARVGLNYRGLTDITNGFIASNSLTLKYLLIVDTDSKIF